MQKELQVKKLFRFGIRYFKPNDKIKNKNGIFIYRLNDKNQYSIDVIGIDGIENKKRNMKQIVEIYDNYLPYIQDKDSLVMIIEYFQINEQKGQDAETITNFAKQELYNYLNNKMHKPNKDNCKNLTCKI